MREHILSDSQGEALPVAVRACGIFPARGSNLASSRQSRHNQKQCFSGCVKDACSRSMATWGRQDAKWWCAALAGQARRSWGFPQQTVMYATPSAYLVLTAGPPRRHGGAGGGRGADGGRGAARAGRARRRWKLSWSVLSAQRRAQP